MTNGLTARVYSMEPLSADAKASIHDGLGIVEEQVGKITVQRHSIVRLPVRDGRVIPSKVGYKNLDTATDIHLFVAPVGEEVPVTGADRAKFKALKRLGESFHGSGISWISNQETPDITRVTAAHEVAHGLGYVLVGAPQSITAGDGHCSSAGCIMATRLEMHETYHNHTNDRPEDVFAGGVVNLPEGFCTPCRADIHDTIDLNINDMRVTRHVVGAVSMGVIKLSGVPGQPY